MNTLLVIAAVIILAAIVTKKFLPGTNPAKDNSRAADAIVPTHEVANDKIIVVNNVTHEDIKQALNGFCNVYNKEAYVATPRLWKLSSNSFAVTFPHDVDFITYCFAINFLKYPMDIKWDAHVRAWATTRPGDDWITDKSIDKKVMLFLAVDDKDYDNVFLTTQDNIGYKLGFATREEKQLLSSPKESFITPTLDVSSLVDQPHEDFK